MTDENTAVVLVTGASRGIGAAIADGFIADGATVVGTATSQAGAEKISDRFAASGGRGTGMVLDVTDKAACEAILAAITEQFGAVTVLVNNAGITRDTLVMRMKEDDWDAVISTNLTSVWRMSKLAIKPMMKARSGRGPGQLCVSQSRAVRYDKIDGHRTGLSRHYGQCHCSGLYRVGYDE